MKYRKSSIKPPYPISPPFLGGGGVNKPPSLLSPLPSHYYSSLINDRLYKIEILLDLPFSSFQILLDNNNIIFVYYIDTSVLLENIPLVKIIKTTSGTPSGLFSIISLFRKILFWHSKITFISSRHRVISSIYTLSCLQMNYDNEKIYIYKKDRVLVAWNNHRRKQSQAAS